MKHALFEPLKIQKTSGNEEKRAEKKVVQVVYAVFLNSELPVHQQVEGNEQLIGQP